MDRARTANSVLPENFCALSYHSAQLDRGCADACRDILARIPTTGMPRCCSTARWYARGSATRLSGRGCGPPPWAWTYPVA